MMLANLIGATILVLGLGMLNHAVAQLSLQFQVPERSLFGVRETPGARPVLGADTSVVLLPGFAHLFTPSVLEPDGFTAVCLATNLDSVDRVLVAQIVDASGVNVNETSTCGVAQAPGATCHSTASFRNNSGLRCVVSTSGRVPNLRGGMTTSSGPFPFTSAANLTVAAE